MLLFHVISYYFSLLISALTFIIIIYSTQYLYQTIGILPKALRLFLIICYFPSVIINAVLTFIIVIIYLENGAQYNSATDIINITTSFATQNIRNFFFIIICERIVATILLEKYQLSHTKILSATLIFCSQAISLCFISILLYSRYIASTVSTEILTFIVFGVYAVTMVVCILLYFLNMRMYKITAYKVTLKKRHQIVENVKVLSFMFPSILIYTILAPMASVITIIAFTYKFPPLPYCIGPIFSNLPHLLICVRLILIKRNSATRTNVKFVTNALGNNLPITLTNDNYFKELRQQWK